MMAKLPGKTAYSGTRRPATRSAGFSSHPDTTGGEWDTSSSEAVFIHKGTVLTIEFSIPEHSEDQWVGFGGWFCADDGVRFEVICDAPKHMLTAPCAPDWSKFGSIWKNEGKSAKAYLIVKATEDAKVSFWKLGCGTIKNPGCHSGAKFIECDQESYLNNMHLLSPEAHFWVQPGVYTLMQTEGATDFRNEVDGAVMYVKSCNRCGRYLPFNVHNERLTLSFSNHCLSRRPCRHSTFGRPRNVRTGEFKQLEYGFQLECRYCKKYCVNWAHNKQRSAAQMKEDGARRRYFEVLIAELFQTSKQLAFKKNGKELSDLILNNFGHQCFACGKPLPGARDMHLDHTRPLALLWPLDDTATALCGPCNSSKSDRFPNEFYDKPGQLEKLGKVTGIPLEELQEPGPNMAVVNKLMQNLDWFFSDFLTREVLVRERDGKVAAELVVKSLQRVLDSCPGGPHPVNLEDEYRKRQEDGMTIQAANRAAPPA